MDPSSRTMRKVVAQIMESQISNQGRTPQAVPVHLESEDEFLKDW